MMASDNTNPFDDDLPLASLTIGQFKQLMRELLAQKSEQLSPPEPSIKADVSVRRKSLDEFMSDLSDKTNS